MKQWHSHDFPISFEQVNKPILRRSLRNDTDSSEGGSIALNGGGVWQFPNDMVHCPICGPGRADLSRIKLIDHYKRHHAPWAILCQICNEPISIQKDPNNFMKHYKTIHPDSELPDASHELPRSQVGILQNLKFDFLLLLKFDFLRNV